MKLQPTFQGHLITLRPLKDSDFDELFQCASDPLIWEQHPQRDRYERTVFANYFAVIRLFNREVKQQMIHHAFQTVDAVYFEIGIDNRRSRRAIEKIGAVLIKEAVYDKKPHAVYVIHKNKWNEL